MDFHVITAHGSELLLRVIDGQVIIPSAPVEPPAGPAPAPPPPPAPR